MLLVGDGCPWEWIGQSKSFLLLGLCVVTQSDGQENNEKVAGRLLFSSTRVRTKKDKLPKYPSLQHHGCPNSPSSLPSPMCADAQTANLFSRKLIRSRSLDESLSTLETSQRPSLLVPFVLAKGWP